MKEPEATLSIATGLSTDPEPAAAPAHANEQFSVQVKASDGQYVPDEAAHILVKHLFAQPDSQIHDLSYAVAYKLAQQHAGGDIVDIYHFDNDYVALSVADISGKGTQAAVHAALIKYGLRAYASQGLTPEKILRALDRLYLENNAFDGTESFATVFFGLVDSSRRLMTFASAAHEPVFLIHPDGAIVRLPVTAPLIGVFDDQHHLFKERFVELHSGSLFIAASDGVTEARDHTRCLFGLDRLIDIAYAHRAQSEQAIVDAILQAVDAFCGTRFRDDIAVVVARFH